MNCVLIPSDDLSDETIEKLNEEGIAIGYQGAVAVVDAAKEKGLPLLLFDGLIPSGAKGIIQGRDHAHILESPDDPDDFERSLRDFFK